MGAPPILDATLVPPFFAFAPTSVAFTPTSVTFSLQSFFPISFESEPQEVGVALTLPEPGSLAVLGCGLLGLGLPRRQRL